MVSNVVFQCRSCGEELRTEPRSCPFCGASEPTRGERPSAGPAAIADAIARERESEEGEVRALGIFARRGNTGRREPRLGSNPAPWLGGVTKDGGSGAAAPPPPAADSGAERAAAADLRLIRPGDNTATGEFPAEPGRDHPAGDWATSDEPQRTTTGDTVVRITPADAEDAETFDEHADAAYAADGTGAGEADIDEDRAAEMPASPRARGGALVVASRRGRELAPAAARQGISFVARLIRITAMALIIIGIIGAGNWWMQNNNLGDLGLDPATSRSSSTAAVVEPPPTGGDTLVIEPDDDWTVVLPEGEATSRALLRSSAPVRVRVDGATFLVPADRSARISAAAGPIEVKAIEAGTEVAVTRLGDGG